MSEDQGKYLTGEGGCGSVRVNEGEPMALKEANRLVNRHKARLLTHLEDAGCPQIFRNAVVAELDWLRSDLNKLVGIGGNNELQGNDMGCIR